MYDKEKQETLKLEKLKLKKVDWKMIEKIIKK